MAKRRRLPPDTRPDWRDPNMQVLVMPKSGGQIYIDPARWQRVCALRLSITNEPDWRHDPTYHLRRKPK